jgi:exo-beta-1,3-glucanase (GH17 family)
LKKRIRIIAPYTLWIRTFGTSNGLDSAGQIAHKFGLKAAIGAWLTGDLAANEREIATLIQIARAGDADLLVVGSEVLLRGDLTESQLISYINRVKQAAPGIPVTTVDVYAMLLSHPNVLAAADVVFGNIYPFWEGISVTNAVSFLDDKFRQLREAAGGKPVVISETGWPSCGNAVGNAVPSPQNASAYFRGFVTWARTNDAPSFYFEALDESWKAKYEGPQGARWGIWDQEGNVKPGMQIP